MREFTHILKEFDFDNDWDYNAPVETFDILLVYLSSVESGFDKEYHAQFLTQIARKQSLQHNWDLALDYFSKKMK